MWLSFDPSKAYFKTLLGSGKNSLNLGLISSHHWGNAILKNLNTSWIAVFLLQLVKTKTTAGALWALRIVSSSPFRWLFSLRSSLLALVVSSPAHTDQNSSEDLRTSLCRSPHLSFSVAPLLHDSDWKLQLLGMPEHLTAASQIRKTARIVLVPPLLHCILEILQPLWCKAHHSFPLSMSIFLTRRVKPVSVPPS